MKIVSGILKTVGFIMIVVSYKIYSIQMNLLSGIGILCLLISWYVLDFHYYKEKQSDYIYTKKN